MPRPPKSSITNPTQKRGGGGGGGGAAEKRPAPSPDFVLSDETTTPHRKRRNPTSQTEETASSKTPKGKGQGKKATPRTEAGNVITISDGAEEEQPTLTLTLTASQKAELYQQTRISVITTSQNMITIIAGAGEYSQTFHVHRELLVLHSSYLRPILTKGVEQERVEESPAIKVEEGAKPIDELFVLVDPVPAEKKIHLPAIAPTHFARFVAFIYGGFQPFVTAYGGAREWESLWTLGCQLKAPSFQNLVMGCLCIEDKVRAGKWPTAIQARIIYDITSEGSQLRKFAAACISANNPFEAYHANTVTYGLWTQLYQEKPEIMVGVLKAGGKKWQEGKPWKLKWRHEFLAPEEPIYEVWKKAILKERTEVEVKKAADGGCVRSRVEAAVLEATAPGI